MTAGIRLRIFGQIGIVDGRVKHLVRRSPDGNNRTRAIAACARGKPLEERKKCFKVSGPSGGGKTQGKKK